jgi:hypothetical protein
LLCLPPEFSRREPVEPTLEVPVVKTIDPLVPVCPASGDDSLKDPEDVIVLAPDISDIDPPVRLSPRPALKFIKPPIASVVPLAIPLDKVTAPPRTEFAELSPAETEILPLFKCVPDSTDNAISPPLPFVADPVLRRIAPLAPPLVVPDVKVSSPLTPETPAFAVFTRMEPLDLVVPCMALRLIVPPVSSFVLPVDTETSPPSEVVPVPTDIITFPPRPSLEFPLANSILPELPELVVPVRNDKCPLAPATPALSVFRMTLPVEVAVPKPVARLIAPPVLLAPIPEVSTK